MQHRAAIDVGTLAEEDLIRYLRCLEGGDAVAVYAEHLAVGPSLPAAERAVADRLVIDRGWDGIEHSRRGSSAPAGRRSGTAQPGRHGRR